MQRQAVTRHAKQNGSQTPMTKRKSKSYEHLFQKWSGLSPVSTYNGSCVRRFRYHDLRVIHSEHPVLEVYKNTFRALGLLSDRGRGGMLAAGAQAGAPICAPHVPSHLSK